MKRLMIAVPARGLVAVPPAVGQTKPGDTKPAEPKPTAPKEPTLPEGITKGSTVEGLTEYVFKNGLKVILLPDASSPKVTVNCTIFVGSRHEGYGETGHGPPARAHGLQGQPEVPGRAQGPA